MRLGPVFFRFVANLCLILLSAVLADDVALAQEAAWQLDGPCFQASAVDIRTAAAHIPAEKFMDATVLFERDTYRFESNGRVAHEHAMIFRIETQQAVEDWAETSARYAPWYQHQPQILARVIEVDGHVNQLDPTTVSDGPAKENDADTYTDERIRKAPLPGLAVGAIVEEQTVTEDKLPFFSGGGIYRDFMTRDVPIVRGELIVDAPSSIKLQYRVHHLASIKIGESDNAGRHHLAFDQAYTAARSDSDIDLPSRDDQSPMIEFSTGDSWATVSSAYRQLAEAHIDPEKVKPLLTGMNASTRTSRIEQIVARLHKEIRYTGIEFGEASIQPAFAADILKRHYGDCKDKAAVLVAMLRGSGIPASLALLATGPGRDVTPDLPGMDQFDHAIVYVPAASGADAPAMWIDATAEYTHVGDLPGSDQGREALIIAEDTTGLTITPTLKPEDDHLTEVREVVMAPYGPAHITETSFGGGEVDADYRSYYGAGETREARKDLETYARDQYLAKALNGFDHSDGKDLTKAFTLKLDMAEARRGNTDIEAADVGIPYGAIFSRLPQWFRTDPKTKGEKLTEQQEEDLKRAAAARTTEYEVHPFLTEWKYRITPPQGFVLRALPEDKTTPMGPASLSQHYEVGPDGLIVADIQFSTGKPRYSVEEVLALRDAVLAAYRQDMIQILFDQQGAKLLAAGKAREALAADRALIEQHPHEGLAHAQMSYALLKAGMGQKARSEAEQAVALNPKSAVSFKALGWVCQFNAIGVEHGSGFDWDCASAAYKKAMALDPNDNSTLIDLAILDEYDHDGARYSSGAPLSDGIRLFRSLIEKDKEASEPYRDNLLFDLLYNHQYKDLLKELSDLPSSVSRDALGISATVALEPGTKGIADGIARADHLTSGVARRNSALTSASSQLLYLRMYPEAAEMLAASTEGQTDSAGNTQRIGILRQLRPWNGDYLPATDARGVVQHLMLGFISGQISGKSAEDLLDRHAYGSEVEWQRNTEKYLLSRSLLRTMSKNSDLPASALLDLIAGNLKLSSDGDQASGYKVSMQSIGSKAQSYFVVSEEGKLKIVTEGTSPSEAGNEALYLLNAGRDREARALLDWMRDRVHKGGGDDPLSGPLLPRFWSVGEAPDHKAMVRAAASLVTGNVGIREVLPAIRADWDRAATDQERLDLGLLLANGYTTLQDGVDLRTVSASILAKYPDSYVAIEFAENADLLLKDWGPSAAIFNSQLAKHPDDENLLRLKARSEEAQGNFVLSRQTLQKLFDDGKASAVDYNNYGWSALFDGKIDDSVIKAAQQATMLTKNAAFGDIHTLACLYAVQGRTKEARDLLLKAMALQNLSEPNSEIWFGLGLIYEQYGVTDAAVEAYQKVEQPEGRIDPTSTWLLAQARLKALGIAKAG